LGLFELSLVDLVHFKLKDFERDLVETDCGTIWVRVRYISLNYNFYKSAQALFSPQSNQQKFDRYGFTVGSKEVYLEALKMESEYSSEFPSLILGCQRAARVGIGFPYKARFWQIFAMRFLKLKESPFSHGLYEQLLELPGNPVVLDQIAKDLPRTFPNHPAFVSEEGRLALGRILKAFSLRHPQIGYTQSMNFISGYLLLLMEEELAFKLLTIIVEYYVPGYYMHTMAGLQADQMVLNHLVQEKLPQVHTHLQSLHIDLNVVTTRWFLCLFIHVLPFPSVLRIWDVLFCKGSCALILAAFAIVCFKEEEIMALTEMGHDSLDHLCQNYYNWEQLIDLMYSTYNFSHVEKLQEDARLKVDETVKQYQMEELYKRTSFNWEYLESCFKKFSEVSKNGSLNMEAFAKILPDELLPFTNDEKVFVPFFNLFDKNGYGTITFREFGIGLNMLLRGNPKDKIKHLFQMFDRDHDGFISKDELQFLLSWQFKTMGFTQVEDMVMASVEMALSTFDLDRDSKLSLEEFTFVAKKQPLFVRLLNLGEPLYEEEENDD
jgi:Ca2+-binding EF-hand superfamily protein